MAKALPKNVIELLNDKETVKILASKSDDHRLHAVPVGSLGATDERTIFFGSILMKETQANLERALGSDDLVSVLVVKGDRAYQMRCKVLEFQMHGALYNKMSAAAKVRRMPFLGVWILEPEEIINQSPGRDCGKAL